MNNSQTLLENIKDSLQSEVFIVIQQSHRAAQKRAPELLLTLMSEVFSLIAWLQSLTHGNLSSSTLLWDFFETEVPSCGCNSEIHLFSCLNERYSQRQRPSGKQTSTQVEKRVSGKCKARCSGSSARSIHYWIRAILIPMVQTTALFHQK